MKTEAQQAAAVAAIDGAPRRIWDFLSKHHFRNLEDVIIATRVAPAEARAAVTSLVKAGLIEAQIARKGEVYRPAPCAVEERVAPSAPRQKEPAAWLETDLEAALADGGHAFHASAMALLRRLLSSLGQTQLDALADDGAAFEPPSIRAEG